MFNLAQIEVTNKCNFNCQFCFRKYMTRKQGFMSAKTYIGALKLCEDKKVFEIWLHNWGEPLLHPHLNQFIREAKNKGFKVGFTSNGSLINFNKLKQFSYVGLDYLDLSFNMNTRIGQLVHLSSIYQRANDLGIDSRLRVVITTARDYNYLNLLLKEFKIRWQRAMIRDTTRVRKTKCKAKEKVFVIQWDGTVVPCCHVVNKEIAYGYINSPIKWHVKSNDFCKHCFEVSSNVPIRYKL